MKAIVLHAKNDLRYEDVADVSITKSTQVLVKMFTAVSADRISIIIH